MLELTNQPTQFADIKFVSFADIHLDYLDILFRENNLDELVVAYIKKADGNFILTEPAVNGEVYEFIFSMLETKKWLNRLTTKQTVPLMLKFFRHNGLLVCHARNVPVKTQ